MARKSFSEIKGRRMGSEAAQGGYERARRAFELGERVRHLREERGLSQRELAEKIGSTQPAIARLEAGGVAPSIQTLERIAAALGESSWLTSPVPPSDQGERNPGASRPDGPPAWGLTSPAACRSAARPRRPCRFDPATRARALRPEPGLRHEMHFGAHGSLHAPLVNRAGSSASRPMAA